MYMCIYEYIHSMCMKLGMINQNTQKTLEITTQEEV